MKPFSINETVDLPITGDNVRRFGFEPFQLCQLDILHGIKNDASDFGGIHSEMQSTGKAEKFYYCKLDEREGLASTKVAKSDFKKKRGVIRSFVQFTKGSCQYSAPKRSDLIKHLIGLHGEKFPEYQFKCTHCDHTALDQSRARIHMDSCHNLWGWATKCRDKYPINADFLSEYSHWTKDATVMFNRPKIGLEIKTEDKDHADKCVNIMNGIGSAWNAYIKPVKTVKSKNKKRSETVKHISNHKEVNPLEELMEITPSSDIVKEEPVDYSPSESMNIEDGFELNTMSSDILSSLISRCGNVVEMDHSEKNLLIFALTAALKQCRTTLEKVEQMRRLKAAGKDGCSSLLLKLLEDDLNIELSRYSDKSETEVAAIADYAKARVELEQAKQEVVALNKQIVITEQISLAEYQQLEEREVKLKAVEAAKVLIQQSEDALSLRLQNAMTDLVAKDELQFKLKNELSESKSQAEKAEAAALLLQEQIATLEKRLPGPGLKLVDMFDVGKSNAPSAQNSKSIQHSKGSYLCHDVAEEARLKKEADARAEERARNRKLQKAVAVVKRNNPVSGKSGIKVIAAKSLDVRQPSKRSQK